MTTLENIDFQLTSLLTADQAHTFRAIPIRAQGETIILLGDTETSRRKSELFLVLGKSISLELTSQEELTTLLFTYYPIESPNKSPELKVKEADASNIVQFVDQVLYDAAQMGVSDIHIECYESSARVRFRWEGQLIEKYNIPLDQYKGIISRIKIMSELDIAEVRLPQDGRIRMENDSNVFDLRVSTNPTKYGEKVVMRLLSRSKEHLQLENVGLGEKELKTYLEVIAQPNGIVLITGPTGSGKTTTLYATLNRLNQPDKNILTIEDPIEYNLEGINQTQLWEEIGLTFDKALKAFLRQDPNIIMVGEIRDKDTARIAIRSALTGRLVFSTLHTNSAWDAVTRMADMGIESYLLAASLRAVVAQRLVRRLCPDCKSESFELFHLDMQWDLSIEKHFIPSGCSSCFFTGYQGRLAVFEILPIDKQLREFIKTGEGDIDQYIAQHDILLLKHQLGKLVRRGDTSIEEALQHWQG